MTPEELKDEILALTDNKEIDEILTELYKSKRQNSFWAWWGSWST